MEETINKKPAELEKEFYSKKFYLSYSGLSKTIYSPSLFYRHYILQQKEEKLDSHLIDGKVIHCLLLDDKMFDKHFTISPANLPTGNTRLVVDRVFAHHMDVLTNSAAVGITSTALSNASMNDYSDTIIEILKKIKLHQSLKTDAQRLEKIITDESKSYFEFMKIKGKKDIIDNEILVRCNEAVTAIRNDSISCNLLGIAKHEMENIDVFNEIHLKSDMFDVYPFGIHGIIDNIKVDYDQKIIYINDLKTTGKTITDFPESVDYFNYWIQAAIYQRLVREAFKDLLTEEWKIISYFIVIDKYNQTYPFQVSEASMMEWQAKLDHKLNEFKWHFTEKKYVLPYQFATSQVTL